MRTGRHILSTFSFSLLSSTSAIVTQHTCQIRRHLTRNFCKVKETKLLLESTRLFGSQYSEGESFATSYHAPVMWKECIFGLLGCARATERERKGSIDESLVFVDGTLGGGGHSEALLRNLHAGDILVGCDVDPEALKTASDRLTNFMNHDGTEKPLFIPVRSNFGDLASALQNLTNPMTGNSVGGKGVDGVLLDLGVSSHQIDTAERGFAFMKDGPLDMRMYGSQESGITAADICNEFDERELQRILSVYGDEPRAKTIARAIVQFRPLRTTGNLAEAIGSVTPAFAKSKRKGRTATCARVFQSLRIVVNNEDGVLEKVLLDSCPSLLRTGGRLVVISYHSMEDRITKRVMRDGIVGKKKFREERDIYGNYVGPPKPFRQIGKRQKASETEVTVNTRSRSASLRIAEKN